MVKASDTGGVKPMAIAGRYVNVRERLIGMTDAERAFRSQWLKDQVLAPNEPRPVPEMYKFFYNPIRRFFRWPMDKFEVMLQPRLGETMAKNCRVLSGKALMFIYAAYAITYYAKYNMNNWTTRSGWRIKQSRTACLPGDEGYPNPSARSKGADYFDRGFNKNTLNL